MTEKNQENPLYTSGRPGEAPANVKEQMRKAVLGNSDFNVLNGHGGESRPLAGQDVSLSQPNSTPEHPFDHPRSHVHRQNAGINVHLSPDRGTNPK